ncbi:MAG: DNA repair exonuclease [Conexivisphaerales archaeon]
MLIGHISDSHLGAIPYNKPERENDFYESFSEAIEIVIRERVQLVVHAGDVFDVPKPSGTALVKLVDSLKKLKEKGIKFVFTMGEHDISRLYSIPSPLLYQHVDLATYIGDGKAREVLDGLTIVGFHKRRKDEVDELKSRLSSLDQELYSAKGKKILVLHQGMYEFHKFAGEINSSDLPKSFDYYAMGHLHDRFEKRFEGLKGPVCYPGSLDATASEGIRELRKGFYIVDLSKQEASTQWIELSSTRKQYSFDIEYEKMDAMVNDIISKIKDLAKKPMLDIVVKGKELDSAKIASSLRKLEDHTLYYQWNTKETVSDATKELVERPADIEQEMLRMAEGILGSKEVATLAINEILPLLAEGNSKEATDILWKYFEERRKI